MLLRSCYPYDYIDEWEKFNETSLLEKEEFYSKPNLQHITDSDYMHAERVWKKFEIKNLSEYHDLYIESDTLLLADVFENWRKICLEIHQLDPAKFFSAPGLAWQAVLKKAKVKLELLTDTDMQLMSEKGVRGGICHSFNRYATANNQYMKIIIKVKNRKYWDVNNLYSWAMSQKLPVMFLSGLKIFPNLMKAL